MNDLLEVYERLGSALTADPQMCLAYAAALLDPIRDEEVELNSQYDILPFALHMTRHVFPDVYAKVVEALHRGTNDAELDRILCEGISAYGIPLDNLEWIGWGVPIPGLGIRLEDPDCLEQNSEIVPLLTVFGIPSVSFAIDCADVDDTLEVPDIAYRAASMLASDLILHEDERWQQVGWAVAWVFSCSGNSTVDYTDEDLSEFQPLEWDRENVAFAVEIIDEADDLLAKAQAGLRYLKESSDLVRVLHRNIDRVLHTDSCQQKPRKLDWGCPRT